MLHDLDYLSTLTFREMTKGQRIAASKAGLIPPVRSERERQLRARYDLLLEDYDALLLQGNGVCWICEQPWGQNLYVDHDHLIGRVRGLLCARCNTLMGMLDEDLERVMRALVYKYPALMTIVEVTDADHR